MDNKNLTLIISVVLFMADPLLAMEKKKGGPLGIPNSSMVQSTLPIEREKTSIDPLNLSSVTTERTIEHLPKRKISKTLPLNRRKSSGSPRLNNINPPKSGSSGQTTAFLEDQRKGHGDRHSSSDSAQDESKKSPGRDGAISPMHKSRDPNL